MLREKLEAAMAIVLLVDDSHLGRTLARLTLARAGHRVIEARDGREGLDRILGERPEVIVAASSLPVMDGLTMVREARSAGVDAPVVLVGTGAGWAKHADTGATRDVASISRSVNPGELLGAVERALHHDQPLPKAA